MILYWRIGPVVSLSQSNHPEHINQS
uniref:Uncharacterized protein n=1 Tax=Tetranychus urticae TaxID=32264 RepID=T1K9N1_TETUR